MKPSTRLGLAVLALGFAVSVGLTAGCRAGPGIDLGVTVPGVGGVTLHTTPFDAVLAAPLALTDAVGVTTPPVTPPTTPAPVVPR